MLELLKLFLVFFKIGSISFGGGYAMIPFLEYETISRNWMTQSSILDMLAVSQVTPGPIATNMATFVGYTNAGILGSIFATVGVTLPSLLLVLFVTRYILDKLTSKVKNTIFYGLRPTVCALLFITAITIPFSEIFGNVDFSHVETIVSNINYFTLFLTTLAFILMKFFNKKTIHILLLCGFISVAYNYFI